MNCTLISRISTGIYIAVTNEVLVDLTFVQPRCALFAYQMLPYNFFGVAVYVGLLRWIHIYKVQK